MKKTDCSRQRLSWSRISLATAGAARAPPIFRPITILHRARRRFRPTAGPAPISAARWAIEWGTVSNNPTHPSRRRPAASRPASIGSTAISSTAPRPTSICPPPSDTFAPWQFSNPWFGTLRGRAGVAIGNVLIYGTAGLAYGGLTADTSGNLSESHTSFGWVAGGGAEVGFTPHWSAKAEWLYLDFADALLGDRHQ